MTQKLPMKSYSIDTRTLKTGDIFVAIVGENRDGHDFVSEAFKQGASAAIVQNNYSGNEKNLIRVPDTLKALQDLAHEHLIRMPAKRVALTGSSGKTTTRELITAVLKACLGEEAVFSSSGNLNNHLGVPLMALQVRPEHQVAIFEMGMNHFGEIARLAEIVRPQVGLITMIGSAHAGNLGGPEGVAKAKAEIFEALGPEDIGIVNADDPRCVREAGSKLKGRKISFGGASWADVRILDYAAPTFSYQNQTASPKFPLLGAHNVQNAAGALAVAVALGLDFEKAASGLSTVSSHKGRLMQKNLKNGAILIDDTYNANPESMEAGLNVLVSFPGKRYVAVLGDMGELGDLAPNKHHAIGAACAQKGVNLLFACGAHAKHYGEGAFEAGLPPKSFIWAPDSASLGTLAAAQIEPNDVIWVKGSRFMKMEHAVDTIIKYDK